MLVFILKDVQKKSEQLVKYYKIETCFNEWFVFIALWRQFWLL